MKTSTPTALGRMCQHVTSALMMASSALPVGHALALDSPAVLDFNDRSAAIDGSSPFAAPDPDDTIFVVDLSPGLDRGCTFRDFGPRIIQVPVTRYVADVASDGTLLNVADLVANGVVSPTATIRMPVYDIDSSADVPGYAPEIDRVEFNGHVVGFLSGENNVWKQNEFTIPIDWIQFPSRGGDGVLPTPAMNELRIYIDVGNAAAGILAWCMDVDWVELQFGAIAPLLLVHGTNSNAGTWNGDVVDTFSARHIPFSNNINMPGGGNASIDRNAQELRSRVINISKSFGAKRVHLVAHSKGGLDCRRFLSAYAEDIGVEVLSLYTISSPHAGTIASDLANAHRNINDPSTDDPLIQAFWDLDFWWIRLWVPRGDAIIDQTIPNMATFNAANPYTHPARFYNFAADADTDNSGGIERAETDQMSAAYFVSMWNLMYHVLGRIGGITVTRRTNFFGLNEWHEVAPIPTPSFQANDLVVTARSAQHPAGSTLGGIRDDNHSTIKSASVANTIVNRIRADFPLQ